MYLSFNFNTGDGGESAGHDDVDLGLCELGQIRLDEERGHCLAEEDVGGCVEGLAGRRADRDAEEPANLLRQPLDGAVVKQDVHDEREEVDDGERL